MLRINSTLCEASGDYECALRDLVAVAGDNPDHNEQIWRLLNQSLSLATDHASPAWRLPKPAAHDRLVDASAGDGGSLFPARPAAKPFAGGWRSTRSIQPPSSPLRRSAAYSRTTSLRPTLPWCCRCQGRWNGRASPCRDGFIAASLSAEASAWLTLSIYDAAQEPLPVLYERILADGADLIVGPLQKPSVTALRELNPTLPVLALNYLDDAVPEGSFIQFGLAIEDEASTIARRLQADGITRAVLFHNYEDWSLRARRTLSNSADQGNRLDLTIQPFTDLRTITESVGTAMHVTGSQSRRDELSRLLGEELEFLPRAREDIEAVVALVDNTEANALVPALRFHFASHLPVYASSQTTRRARAGSLSELGGFHVSELPYFLAGDPVFANLAGPFDLPNNPFASLIALGSDAFRVAERIEPEGKLVLIGSTGLLRQQADGRISRELAWGTINGGAIRGSTAPTSMVGADD